MVLEPDGFIDDEGSASAGAGLHSSRDIDTTITLQSGRRRRRLSGYHPGALDDLQIPR